MIRPRVESRGSSVATSHTEFEVDAMISSNDYLADESEE
jgi:hypothetical protein